MNNGSVGFGDVRDENANRTIVDRTPIEPPTGSVLLLPIECIESVPDDPTTASLFM